MRLMNKKQTVRCPNCGSETQRHYFTSDEAMYRSCSGSQVMQTECNNCDYLMVMCLLNGNVVEAYAPGINAFAPKIKHSFILSIINK